jgi:hypothetical protein
MIPSVVASELEQVAADAIRTPFHPITPGFKGTCSCGGVSAQPQPHLCVEGLKRLQ